LEATLPRTTVCPALAAIIETAIPVIEALWTKRLMVSFNDSPIVLFGVAAEGEQA
jgi:hypothetical protein